MNIANNINTKKEDIEKYLIKEGSFETTKEYSIIVDFKEESITGACFRNGLLDYLIDTKKCIELLENITKYHTPKRDFSYILKKYTL